MARESGREERAGVPPQAPPAPGPAVRAEHDALAARLAARRSVEALRWSAIFGFGALVSFGVSWGLLWDRYGKTPTAHALAHTNLYRAGFLLTFVGSVVLVALTVAALVRHRRLAREEDRLFARLRELRRALGIDP